MASTPKIWDPLRRKTVALTPEERVRQWLIGVLHDGAGVPLHQMMSEVELRFGASEKVWRADVLIYGRGGAPLAVAECKRPEVALTPAVLEQALRYNCVLDVRCILITNGAETRIFVRHSAGEETPDQVGGDAVATADATSTVMAGSDRPSGWRGADHLMTYEEMLSL